MSNFYEQICETFIRPTRQTYNLFDLGTHPHNNITGQPITQTSKRNDFTVHNNRQDKLFCSLYVNNNNNISNNNCNLYAPCIVYLHSLNGSRLECKICGYIFSCLLCGESYWERV